MWSPIKRAVRLNGQTASQPLGHTSCPQHRPGPHSSFLGAAAPVQGPPHPTPSVAGTSAPASQVVETRQGQELRAEATAVKAGGRRPRDGRARPTSMRPMTICPTPAKHLLLSKREAREAAHKSPRINQAEDGGPADLMLPTPPKWKSEPHLQCGACCPDHRVGSVPKEHRLFSSEVINKVVR